MVKEILFTELNKNYDNVKKGHIFKPNFQKNNEEIDF